MFLRMLDRFFPKKWIILVQSRIDGHIMFLENYDPGDENLGDYRDDAKRFRTYWRAFKLGVQIQRSSPDLNCAIEEYLERTIP